MNKEARSKSIHHFLSILHFGYELFGFVNRTIVKYYNCLLNYLGNKSFYKLNKIIEIECCFKHFKIADAEFVIP
jgi:hypothetical protein